MPPKLYIGWLLLRNEWSKRKSFCLFNWVSQHRHKKLFAVDLKNTNFLNTKGLGEKLFRLIIAQCDLNLKIVLISSKRSNLFSAADQVPFHQFANLSFTSLLFLLETSFTDNQIKDVGCTSFLIELDRIAISSIGPSVCCWKLASMSIGWVGGCCIAQR